MSPFDLYKATFRWRGTEYERPWLLVRRDSGSIWLCFAISSKDYDSAPFEIRQDDPDFPATGLDHTSYVYDAESYHAVPIASMRKHIGCLEGDLLARFRKYAGI